MATFLIDAKDGDKFVTKNGLELTLYSAGKSMANAPYQFCLKSAETDEKHFYSNEGEYLQGKNPEMNLVGRGESEKEKHSEELQIGWETALKIFGWVTLVGCIIAFFILLGDRYLASFSWIPLVYGIIQIAPIMVFANISISLKEANILKKKILNEIKKVNEAKQEEK